jgi:hypothetical protein
MQVHKARPEIIDQRWHEAVLSVPGSPALWSQYFAYLASQGRNSSIEALTTCCVDSTLALARHAATLSAPLAQARGAADAAPIAGAAELSAAECAVVDAVLRHMVLLMTVGKAAEALPLLQAALEWAAFPATVLGAQPMRRHLHRALHQDCRQAAARGQQ